MADSKAPAADSSPAQPAKKSPMKAVGIVATLMIVEAAAVYIFVGKTGPQPAAAHVLKPHDGPDENAPVEIPLIEEKFQNMQTGRVWLWDVSVFVQVKQKNQEKVEARLKQRNAEVKEELSRIISKAQHVQLKEPDRQTLLRQFGATLNKIFENDEHGDPRIERVLIPRCRGFPADFN